MNNDSKQDLRKALLAEKKKLEEVDVPVITVSASFRKEIVEKYEVNLGSKGEIIFSRGHYSEAMAVVEAAKRKGLSSYLVDPMNFVSIKDWGKLEFTEDIGELTARYDLLAKLKRVAEQLLRGKLPVSEAVKPVVLELIENIKVPIVSGHYEVGNVIAQTDKKVVQMVTDPHVSDPYLKVSDEENVSWVVFDEGTKNQFVDKVKKKNKSVNEKMIKVTGPGINPKILDVGKKGKTLDDERPLRLGITTGGLGTNRGEIKKVLDNLVPFIEEPEKIQLFLYSSTHRDFRDIFEKFANENNIRIGDLDNEEAKLRVLHEDSMVDGNRNLIDHMFPWVDGVITKPSGDMAYDVLGSGAFGLYLDPWGRWEETVKSRMFEFGVGKKLDIEKAGEEIMKMRKEGELSKMMDKANKWAQNSDGAKEIVEWQQEW